MVNMLLQKRPKASSAPIEGSKIELNLHRVL